MAYSLKIFSLLLAIVARFTLGFLWQDELPMVAQAHHYKSQKHATVSHESLYLVDESEADAEESDDDNEDHNLICAGCFYTFAERAAFGHRYTGNSSGLDTGQDQIFLLVRNFRL